MHNIDKYTDNADKKNGTSVHAFVDKTTGNLLKAASWKAPAEGPRYFLLDDIDFKRCLQSADWAGHYLYK